MVWSKIGMFCESPNLLRLLGTSYILIVDQCTRRLIREPRLGTQSTSQTPAPQNVKLLDELATERLLTAYSSANGKVTGREALVRWLEAK